MTAGKSQDEERILEEIDEFVTELLRRYNPYHIAQMLGRERWNLLSEIRQNFKISDYGKLRKRMLFKRVIRRVGRMPSAESHKLPDEYQIRLFY